MLFQHMAINSEPFRHVMSADFARFPCFEIRVACLTHFYSL
jgi:hypothetical protein